MFAPPTNSLRPVLSRTDVWIVAVLALFTLVVRGAWFGDPNADLDEQLYSLIANAMLEGQVPFVDLWDRKPYGLFAIFALAHAVVGPGPEAYQVLAAIFTVIGATLTYLLAREQADRATSAGAGLFYVVLLPVFGAHSANSEAFFVPMMLAMAVLVRDPGHPRAVVRGMAAMLIGGIALQTKYTVLPQCLFFGVWALWGQYRRGMPLPRLVALSAGFGALGLLPTALIAAGYALAGHWDAFVFANFVSFFDRLPGPSGRFPLVFVVFFVLIAALALGGMNAARRSWPRPWPQPYIFAILWLLASLATTLLPSTLYLYYLAAMIPSCVLVSLPLFENKPGARLNLPVLMPAVVYLAMVPYQYSLSRENRAGIQQLADAITPQIDAAGGRCLYVFDGPTALYPMTGSCLPTRFIYPDHLNNALERNALGIRQEAEVARILATRPPVIVTADTPVTPQNPAAKGLVDRTIAREYRLATKAEVHERQILVWVLRQ